MRTKRVAGIQARTLLSIAAALAAAAFLLAPVQAAATFKRGTLTILQGKVRVTVNVEVADTPESRMQGLMNRPSLEDDAGMLFVFDSTERWSFWMKNTLIPLSVAFIDDRWEIVEIKDMRVAPNPQTGPFEFYDSGQPARYALEVNQGFFTRRALGVGAKVTATFK
jgi:uncharacterized membrane protein (UPF0127 family)